MGNPPPQVTWHKSGGTIPPNRTELLPGGLHLSHVRKGDEGMYICEMSNGVGQPVRHSAMLYVQGKQNPSTEHCRLSVHTHSSILSHFSWSLFLFHLFPFFVPFHLLVVGLAICCLDLISISNTDALGMVSLHICLILSDHTNIYFYITHSKNILSSRFLFYYCRYSNNYSTLSLEVIVMTV